MAEYALKKRTEVRIYGTVFKYLLVTFIHLLHTQKITAQLLYDPKNYCINIHLL